MLRWFAVVGWLVCVGAAVAQGADRPNIIWIMADDLGVHDLGCYGQKLIQTPQIDRLSTQGTLFTNVYAGAPVCAPSRSVLLTGLHTGHTRVRSNFSKGGGVIGETGEKGRVPLRPEDVTVAEVLKSAGYATAITGKWGLGEPQTDGIPNRQGFDQWFGYLNQNLAANHFPGALWMNQERFDLPGNTGGKQEQYSHDLFTGFAMNFIRTHQKEPFFLYVAYTLPHADHQVPHLGQYADRDWPGKSREYAAMVSRLDADVGKIATLVDELHLSEQTLIFFCSDNGGPAPFNIFQTNGQLRGKKGQVYEGGIRVPMIARWPGHIPAGRVSNALWYFADVLPTLAKIAGTAAPQQTDGVNVLPLLLGLDEKLPDRFLYWEQPRKGLEQAIRWKNWKAVRPGLNAPLELYDLSNDPTESKDVAGQHPQVIQEIETYLKTARTDSEDYPVGN